MNTAILQAEQFGIGTILLRLCLALLCGGIIGLEQAKKDVAEYSEEAMAILAQMTGVTEPEKSFLYDFVEYLIHRNK